MTPKMKEFPPKIYLPSGLLGWDNETFVIGGDGCFCGARGVAKCRLNKIAFMLLLGSLITFPQIPLYKSNKGILRMLEEVTGIAGIAGIAGIPGNFDPRRPKAGGASSKSGETTLVCTSEKGKIPPAQINIATCVT
eukprot:scaffold5300_cov48-Cyclotella_meneghiniana.AAC.3